MNYFEQNYSAFPVLSLLFLGLIVYLFLKLLRFGLPYLVKNRNIRDWIGQYFSLFEMFVWLLFGFVFLPNLLRKNIYAGTGLGLVLFAMFVWIAWYGLRNLIAGFIFRSNNNLKNGELIQIGEYKGTIVRMSYRNLMLDSTDGNLISIPYSKIMNVPLIKISSNEQRHSNSFELQTIKVNNIQKLIQEITAKILMHPRSSLTEKPRIELIDESEKEMRFQIKIYAVDHKYLSIIEDDLRFWAKNIKL